MKTLEEIREYISCPQLGDDHYGKWGALTLEQRATIYDLINIVEFDDIEIKRLKQENEKLNKIRKLRNANTHVENIYYAEGVLLNEPYCDIEGVDNKELLEILQGEE